MDVEYLPAPCEQGISPNEDSPPGWNEVMTWDEEARPRPPVAPLRSATLVWRNRRYLIVALVPLLLCPIPILVNNSMGYTAYTILIMGFFWCTEAISIAVTALFPLVLFPVFGVMPAKDVSVQYFKDTIVLLFGGLMVAVAIEHCNLHRRIALAVLIRVSSKPRWMMFGFMIITAFLSMWINNTATTAIMMPIAQAVLQQLKADNLKQGEGDSAGDHATDENGRSHDTKETIAMEIGSTEGQLQENSERQLPDPDLEARYNLMCKGIVLCVPYAANIGGTATLTGTGPNLIFAGQVQSFYGSDAEVSFGEWMIYAAPGMVVCLLFSWIWLQVLYIDRWCCKKLGGDLDQQGTAQVIRREYEKLGPMSFAEKGVLGHFILLILLWVTRKPGIVPGWSELFADGYVSDAAVVMFVSILLFMFPSRMPIILCGTSSKEDVKERKGPCPALLEWPVVQEKMVWLILLLVGGGFALAEACKVSGLSAWIAEQFRVLDSFPPFAIVLVVTVIIAAFTEVTSNNATVTLFLPILSSLGEGIGVNPLFLMLPATVACSFAFMLPVATAPNAIAFAYGQITVMDMVKTGFMLNLICIFVANASINTLGSWIFDLATFPDWANATNKAV